MGKRGTIITFMILTLGSIAGICGCLISKDTFVMYYGIKSFRVLIKILGGACILFGGGTVLNTISYVRTYRNRLNEIVVEQQAIEEKQRQIEEAQAGLSVKREIDPGYIVKCLKEQKIEWGGLDGELDGCISQFEQMNEYQSRFSRLLTDNDAKTLSDTEEVLEQVEQYMCKNARNVINFMHVADDDAFSKIKEKLNKCHEENQNLLDQTRDFIYAMTEFLNKQGEENDTRILETYKATILSSIKKEIL